MMAKIVPAERGWHVVIVDRLPNDRGLTIRQIDKVTHWLDLPTYGRKPVRHDGSTMSFDPDDLRHVASAGYLMDPKGRLLGWNHEVIANSVYDLNEAYSRWRAALPA